MSRVGQTKVRIADIVFAFSGLTNDWIWKHEGAFEGFRSRGSPDVMLRVHQGCPPPPTFAAEMVCSVAGSRNIYVGEDEWFFEFHPRDRELVPERPPRQLLIFDRRFTSGDLYVSTDAPSERPVFNLSLFLLELLANMLPFHNAMMLHASGICDGGEGIVFAGPSGAGKSTMAGLWQRHDGVRVLNDDRMILRKRKGQWWAYPAAGIGELGPDAPRCVELEAVFLLSHARANTAERKAISPAASSLLPHISLPAYDSVAVNLGLQLLDDLLHEVPVYELGFLPDETAVECVRGALQQR